MEKKIVIRENIKFSVLKGCDLETVIQDIKKVYKDDCPHRTTISRWYHYFKSGGDRTEDSPRSGRPVQPVNPRLIKMISDLIEEDGRISQSMIALLTGESKGYIDHVIREHTEFIRVIAKWVPKVLNDDQKRVRAKYCRDMLSEYKDNWDYLIDNLITVDETWIYFEQPENSRTSGRWQLPGQAPPEVGRFKNTYKKVMATIFWSSRGIIHIDYLKTGKSINAVYYINLLKQVQEKIPRNRRKKVIFLQDNCPAHRAKTTTTEIAKFGWKLLVHPPNSPDLSPSDYYLFRNLKNELRGMRFTSGDHAEEEISGYFNSKSSDHFYRGIEMFQEQLTNVSKNKGSYLI